MKGFLVLNEDKTEGFFTTNEALAYEVRKSSESNCFNSKTGEWSSVGAKFCDAWSQDSCSTQVIEVI